MGRDVSEEDSRSGGKKKVTFDMNVTTYENTSSPDQEEIPSELVKWMEDEEEGEEEDRGGEGDEEDHNNIVTLEYPTPETVWEPGSPKLKVKVD